MILDNLPEPFLPIDVMLPIFFYSDPCTLANCSQACRKWHELIADNDEHLWKMKVLDHSPDGRLPARVEGEKWKDIFSIHYMWSRCWTFRRATQVEVPVLNFHAELPSDSSADASLSESHVSHNIVAAYIATREEGRDVLLQKTSLTSSHRIVYVRQGGLWATRLVGRKFTSELPIPCENLGRHTRIDPAVRSKLYPVSGIARTAFRDINDDTVEAVLDDYPSEEGLLCGRVFAVSAYDADLMRASLELVHVPEPPSEEYAIGRNESLWSGEQDAHIPRAQPFTRIPHIDDSMNSVIMNEYLLAYRTWNGEHGHPIVIIRIHDLSEYATLILDDLAENNEESTVLHLLMTRLHFFVIFAATGVGYVYELATMQRLRSFCLSDLFSDVATIEWVDIGKEETILLMGLEDQKLLWLDLKQKTATLYSRPKDAEIKNEALWIAYRVIEEKAGEVIQMHDQVVCRVFDS